MATLVVNVEVLGAVLTLNPPKPYVGAGMAYIDIAASY